MLISRLVAGSLALGLLPGVVKSDCIPRDFLSLTLETSDTRPAIAQALEIAYPGVSVDTVDGIVTILVLMLCNFLTGHYCTNIALCSYNFIINQIIFY